MMYLGDEKIKINELDEIARLVFKGTGHFIINLAFLAGTTQICHYIHVKLSIQRNSIRL